ncbi:MAG: hypothetical protein HY822_22970 [Acidobacteria bacterium]|nr:hypothetical protein [Acidobacteriota bacterium]
MIGSFIVLIVSLILFLYWFRYTCLLILSAKPARDYAGQVAQINQLGFPGVRDQLRGATATVNLARLEASLDRDYRLLSCLLRQGAESSEGGGLDLEDRILLLDYKVMKLWSALARPIAASQARGAVEEMSDIVAHFANVMGERQALAVAVR